MPPNIERLVLPFALGFPGWLVIGQISGWLAPWGSAAILGLVTAPLARHPLGLLGLWTGMVTSYGAALTAGIFRFLGESWEIAFAGSLAAAAGGYLASTLLFGPFRDRAARNQ